MKILILYFSGTGNTDYCANYLKEHLSENGNEITLGSIEHFPKNEISDYDCLVAGFPVYACDIPVIMRNYLHNIPLTKRKCAYLFCTKAYITGNALKKISEILRSIGYRIGGFADISMPGSDGLAFIKKDSAAARKMCEKDFSQIKPLDSLIEKIKNDIKAMENAESVPLIDISGKPFGNILDAFLNLIYRFAEKRMQSKFRADENCTQCGLCEEICPTHNIKVRENGVSFNGNCCLCMRCIHQCPQAAIQIGKGTVGKMRWKGPDGGFNPERG